MEVGVIASAHVHFRTRTRGSGYGIRTETPKQRHVGVEQGQLLEEKASDGC